MKASFRQSMAQLHTWTGVGFGWALFVILLAGSLAVFEGPITEWMQARPSALWMSLAGQVSGPPSPRFTAGGQHFVRLHFTFHADLVGIWIVGLITVAMLTAIVSGVITHASLLRNIFTFRPGSGPRSWKDAHTVIAVLTLPFLVMIAYTGLVLFHTTYMPAAVMARYADDPGAFRREAYAAPAAETEKAEPAPLVRLTDHPPIYQPADGRSESNSRIVRQTMVVLHLAQFGGAPMRWIYFVSGLAGAAMVASGLVLYVAKRRKVHAEASGRPSRVFRAVERINVAVVAGLCVASVAFFWINRLVPAGIQDRSRIELSLFFAVWAACLAHAAVRGPDRGWREQFAAAAALCAGLPLINALSSDASLSASVSAGDWSDAGVDLATVAFAAVFGALAWRLRRTAAVEAPSAETAESGESASAHAS